jgi:DNA polymerase-3 subunit delta
MSVAIHLVCGGDDYLVEQKARAILDAAVPLADRTLGLEMVDGRVDTKDTAIRAIRQTIEAVQTPGFFGSGKMVWLKNANFLNPLTRPGNNEDVKNALSDLTAFIKQGVPEGQRLLVTALSVTRNSAFFKACQSAGEVSDFGGNEKPWEKEKLARERLDGILRNHGVRMSEAVRERFLKRTGVATRIMAQEAEKLSLFLGKPDAEATAKDVDNVVSVGREAEAWDVTDALGERDAKKLVAALRLLQAQEANAIGLATMAETRIRDLLVLRYALDQQWLQARQSGRGTTCQWKSPLPADGESWLQALGRDPRSVAPFIQGKQAEQATNYTLNELRRARHMLIQLREKLVSSSLPPDMLVETTLLRIVSAPRAGARRAAVGVA